MSLPPDLFNTWSVLRISCCIASVGEFVEFTLPSTSNILVVGVVGVLIRLRVGDVDIDVGVGGDGADILLGSVSLSLSGRVSNASTGSKVNLLAQGSFLTNSFLFPVAGGVIGSWGDGLGFSKGDPGGDDILLSTHRSCSFDDLAEE